MSSNWIQIAHQSRRLAGYGTICFDLCFMPGGNAKPSGRK